MTAAELLAVFMPLVASLLGVWTVLALGSTPGGLTKHEALHDGGYVRGQIWLQVFFGAGLAALVLFVLFGGPGSSFPKAVEENPPWALVSGIAAAPALIMLWRWRTVQRAKDQLQRDRELDQHERELEQRDQVDISSRFAEAVKLLSGEGFDRLGGVYALEQVAIDAPITYHSVVVETLCAYVRSESSPTESELSDWLNHPRWGHYRRAAQIAVACGWDGARELATEQTKFRVSYSRLHLQFEGGEPDDSDE